MYVYNKYTKKQNKIVYTTQTENLLNINNDQNNDLFFINKNNETTVEQDYYKYRAWRHTQKTPKKEQKKKEKVEIITPSLNRKTILPGIVRDIILQICKLSDYIVIRKDLTLEELKGNGS